MNSLVGRAAPLLGWTPLLGGAALIVAHGDPLQLHVATLIAIWALWGTSFNIVWGYAGQFSMAQIALGAVGAYTVGIVSRQLHWNIWLALVVAIAVAVAISIVMGAAALRLSGFYFAIMTLAFASLILRIAQSWDRVGRTTGMPAGSDFGSIDIGGLSWNLSSNRGGFLGLCIAFLALVLLALGRLERTRTGRSMVATREDQTLGSAFGIHPVRYRILAFALSAVVAATAGVLYGAYLKFISPSFFATGVLITLILEVVIGGAGHRFGPLLGATVYLGITEYFKWGGTHSSGLFGVILIVMVLIAPNGLLGRAGGLVESYRRGRADSDGVDAPSVADVAATIEVGGA